MVSIPERRQQISIPCFTFRGGGGPCRESLFLLLLFRYGPDTPDPARLPDHFFPVVGDTVGFRGILYPDQPAFVHGCIDDIKALLAQTDAEGIFTAGNQVDSVRSKKAISSTWITHHHGKIIFFHTFNGNRQGIFWFQRNIVF